MRFHTDSLVWVQEQFTEELGDIEAFTNQGLDQETIPRLTWTR